MTQILPTPPASNLPEYTVSELSLKLKRTVEDAFGLVRVRGEISGFKRATSGHLYLTLKDTDAAMDAVCWKGSAGRLGLKPEDGLEVICTGKLTTFPGRSKYQLIIERMEVAGVGALMALLEQRKQKLAAEGLFAAERKRPLPYIPEVIGVVTSPTGAVIRDILHRLRDRFPRRVLIWPVLVQGEGAAEQVARAIAGFNELAVDGPVPRPDLLIVARGGGSLEDLWAFNEEVVVRAAASSTIPLISAVGHETDTTLIDFASDRRAPTPTAAAEMAVPVRLELVANLADYARRKTGRTRALIADRRTRLADLARALRNPRELLGVATQRLDDLTYRLPRGLTAGMDARRGRLAAAAGGLRPAVLQREVAGFREQFAARAARLERERAQIFADHRRTLDNFGKLLESMSYQRVLERGYAVVRTLAGQPITRRAAAEPGMAVEIEFQDGRQQARLGSADTDPEPLARKPVSKPLPPGGKQGSLL